MVKEDVLENLNLPSGIVENYLFNWQYFFGYWCI